MEGLPRRLEIVGEPEIVVIDGRMPLDVGHGRHRGPAFVGRIGRAEVAIPRLIADSGPGTFLTITERCAQGQIGAQSSR